MKQKKGHFGADERSDGARLRAKRDRRGDCKQDKKEGI